MPSCFQFFTVLFLILIHGAAIIFGCISNQGLPAGVFRMTDAIYHSFRVLVLVISGQELDRRFLPGGWT